VAKALYPTGRPNGPPSRTPRATGSAPIPAIGLATSLATIEFKLGGRDALVAALSHAPYSQTLSLLLGLIGDPTRSSTPLAQLTAMAGVTAGELLEAYIAGDRLRAEALSVSKISAKLPEVAADTMRRAIPHTITCSTCRGTGTVTPVPTKQVPDPQPETCESCGGTRLLDVEGDLEHKKLALDMGRLLPKSAGMTVAIQNNNSMHGGTAGGSLEALQAATDAILYGDGVVAPEPWDPPAETEILDADVLESASELDAAAEEACGIEEDWRGDQPAD
jgi:hypothetical protein